MQSALSRLNVRTKPVIGAPPTNHYHERNPSSSKGHAFPLDFAFRSIILAWRWNLTQFLPRRD
jgi:hypothetical protein